MAVLARRCPGLVGYPPARPVGGGGGAGEAVLHRGSEKTRRLRGWRREATPTPRRDSSEFSREGQQRTAPSWEVCGHFQGLRLGIETGEFSMIVNNQSEGSRWVSVNGVGVRFSGRGSVG